MIQKTSIRYTCVRALDLPKTRYGKIEIGVTYEVTLPNHYRHLGVRDGMLMIWSDDEFRSDMVYNLHTRQWEFKDRRRKI